MTGGDNNERTLMEPIDPVLARRASRDAVIEAALDLSVTTTVVNSPPGAGKSTLVRETVRRAGATLGQLPVIVQTNEQADDMVAGFLRELAAGTGTGLRVGRLHRGGYTMPLRLQADPNLIASDTIAHLARCDVIVGTADKWARVTGHWNFAIVDEAYQMRSDKLLPIGALTERLLMVGDPGQLAPFTTADATHLRGLELSPLQTAAATVLLTQPDARRIALPVSWRLPQNAVDLLAPSFYEQPFVAGVPAGIRRLQLPLAPVDTPAQAAVTAAAAAGWAFVELPDLMMTAADATAVDLLADIVSELLTKNITVHDEHGERELTPDRVAVGVTHRVQQAAVRDRVDEVCRDAGIAPGTVVVDTANRVQGREFDIVVAWHPLSGRRDATAFHLDAGRLCVLLSRHRQACIVVSRAGLQDQLMAHAPTDPVWIAEQVPVVDGWEAHLSVLDHLNRYRIAA